MTQAFNSTLDLLQQRLGNVIFRSDRLIYEFLLTFYTSQALVSSSAKLCQWWLLCKISVSLFMSIHNTLSIMSIFVLWGSVWHFCYLYACCHSASKCSPLICFHPFILGRILPREVLVSTRTSLVLGSSFCPKPVQSRASILACLSQPPRSWKGLGVLLGTKCKSTNAWGPQQ